ncbi:hypothetical protein [Streptomyces sp. NPDC057002]|uniref:hypothetical protein n=1 Tax=Streptomyces sp. NPDC057002 TaxID=3345992 RepID=UPI00363CDB5D
MLPVIAGIAARVGLSTAARGAATSASRAAVTSAARSGAISAGTAPAATTGSRMLSAAQFGASGYRAGQGNSPNQTAAPIPTPAPAGDGLGWARS